MVVCVVEGHGRYCRRQVWTSRDARWGWGVEPVLVLGWEVRCPVVAARCVAGGALGGGVCEAHAGPLCSRWLLGVRLSFKGPGSMDVS